MLPNKILVIRGGAIGDFILTLPALAALRSQFPRSHLEVLGYPHIAQLARSYGVVDAVRSIEAGALAGFFAQNGVLNAGLQDYFASFALILSYLYDPDGVFQENVARCSRAQFIAGPHRPDETASLHATAVFLKPLERLAIFEAEAVPRLRRVVPASASARIKFPEESDDCAPDHLPPGRLTLVLHPGSGSERKNWPEENWASLLPALAECADLGFLLVGGEAEGTKLERLAALLPEPRLRVARSLPLPELAARLSACDAFLGHDSGISHLAAALELETLVLWGNSVEAVWRPLGRGVRILRDPGGLAALPVQTVLENVRCLLGTAE